MVRKEGRASQVHGQRRRQEGAGRQGSWRGRGRQTCVLTAPGWLCIIFCKVKLTEMEAILHGTVAMANKWEFCGLHVSPLPHLPPLMTAATCCFIVTAGASSHSLVLSSAHEHQALSSPHYFDERFMVSTHEDLIEAVATRAGFREWSQLQEVVRTDTGCSCLAARPEVHALYFWHDRAHNR